MSDPTGSDGQNESDFRNFLKKSGLILFLTGKENENESNDGHFSKKKNETPITKKSCPSYQNQLAEEQETKVLD